RPAPGRQRLSRPGGRRRPHLRRVRPALRGRGGGRRARASRPGARPRGPEAGRRGAGPGDPGPGARVVLELQPGGPPDAAADGPRRAHASSAAARLAARSRVRHALLIMGWRIASWTLAGAAAALLAIAPPVARAGLWSAPATLGQAGASVLGDVAVDA